MLAHDLTAVKSERVALIGLAVIAALASARAAVDVLLPAVWALLAACATHPLYVRLKRRGPAWLAALGVFVVLLGVLVCLGAGLGYCAQTFMAHLSQNDWQTRELEIFGQTVRAEDARQWVETQRSKWTDQGVATVTGLVLMLALATLALLESDYVRRWSREQRAHRLSRLFSAFSADVRRYLWVRTLLGLITGSVVALGCWILGIRLPLVWGITNFLLNYIPTVGSVLGSIPPVVFTLADTGDPQQALLALAIVGGTQLVLGNWVDPLLQGKYLEMSPTVVLLSVTFWGWLWGPWGAFIGVPLVLFIGRACQLSPATQGISRLILRGAAGSPENPKGTHEVESDRAA